MATYDELLAAGFDLDRAWRGGELLPPRPSGRHELTRAQEIFSLKYHAKISLRPGDKTRAEELKVSDPERYQHERVHNRLHGRWTALKEKHDLLFRRAEFEKAAEVKELAQEAERAIHQHRLATPRRPAKKAGWQAGRHERMTMLPRRDP